MINATRRRRISLAQWRIDDLESWFTAMSVNGWELKTIKRSYALFDRINAQKCIYYCHIFDDKKNALNKTQDAFYQYQIDEIEQFGWNYVATYGQIGVFRNSDVLPVHYPVSSDKEISRIESFYIRTTGKIRFPWIGILLTVFAILQALTQLDKFLVSPLTYIAVLAVFYSIIKVPTILISRAIAIKVIRKRYKEIPPHCHPVDTPLQICVKQQLITQCLKIGLAFILMSLIILPIIPISVQWIRYGEFPPIPKGEIPILRLSDVKPEFHPVTAEKGGTPSGFYRAYPGLLLSMYSMLNESDGKSYVMSIRYQTIATWYANFLFNSKPDMSLSCNEEIDHPEKYGFERVLVNTDGKSNNYVIIAIRNRTIYETICWNVTSSLQEVLVMMKAKAGE